MRRSRKSVVATAAVLSVLAYSTSAILAQSRPSTILSLTEVTSLRCFSGTGYSVSWDDGKPEFKLGRFPSEGEHMQFDAIDVKNGRARLIGNAGAADVEVLETKKGLHFFERTGTGNLNVTTVFSLAPEQLPPRSFVFVASRHVDLGMPELGPSIYASQYHGICKAWE
jgi:hypothetical protein